jgi:PAS domain S-box-containing protein
MPLSAARLFIAFALVIGVFAGTAYVQYRAIENILLDQRNRFAQRLITVELQKLLTLAIDAETGQRGFVITGQDEYLESYYQARKMIPVSIGVLAKYLANDPTQLNQMKEIERLQNTELDELEESIRVRKEQGLSAAKAIVITNRDKAIMDEIRQRLAAVQHVEDAKLNRRIAEFEQSAEEAFAAIAVTAVLNISLLLLLYMLIRSDARRREAATRERANADMLLRNVIDGSPATIHLKDANGNFLLVNKTYRELIEGDHSKAGTGSELLPQPRSAQGPSAADLQVLESGGIVQSEEEVNTSEGVKHFAVSRAPLRDHEGKMIGVCAVAVDITPLKEAEAKVSVLVQTLERRVEQRTAELNQSNRQLLEANDQLEAFSYTVAHDLRAPLRGIRGFSEAVIEDYGTQVDETGRGYLRRISRAAARMERLIDDLLSFSRLSRMELPLGTVSLDEVLRDAISNISSQVEHSNASVTIAPGLPMVRANRAACVQIFQNLLSNAIKFAQPGVRSIVKVWPEQAEVEQNARASVRIWVKDNGIGIPAAQTERIFRPFERLHGIDEYQGSGIGLAVVDKAARRMDGRCGVEAAEGRGSCFWVELPAIHTEGQ